ncbi:integrase [Canicola haemoglobinophilus]|uniref:Integrase n=1 Tax=Canicola haemoglobinophilus TaxID=733 RepID=A0AB38HAZ7_9PAST|nr:integrase arm-type DNA-binding domain-containing protein [Canicola haemoglobinophilus]STO54900.1 integrase [Canicola haemoglobinophilus]STO69529.1 integrase [Canicola haemoglobinophilus]
MAKIIQPLTNTQIEKAKYSKNGKNELNDGGGLFLQLTPVNSKIWRFRYNQPSTGKRTKLTLGEYPALSLAQARNKREEYRALLARGIDLQIHKQQQKRELELAKSNTFLAIAEQWKAKKEGEIELKTLDKYWRSLELHIFPFIGAFPVSDITPTLALEALKRVESRNNFDMAQRLASYINEILNFAVNGGAIPFNPCQNMRKNIKSIKKRNNPHLKSEETPLLMATIENARIEPQTRALIKFQLLTMVRPSEASRAEWEEFDFDNRIWTIPAQKMKARAEHQVPLSSQAIDILKELMPITGRFKYVFPKRGDNHSPADSSTANTALKRMGFKDKQTAHGLRGLARTYLAEQSITHEHAEACLAHKTGDNTSLSYNHSTYLEQRKNIMQLWGDFIKNCSEK